MIECPYPQRVLIIHCSYKIKSGEGVIVNNEAKLLRTYGVDVALLILDNTHNFYKTLLYILLAPFNIISFFKVYRKIKFCKPNVVHVHNWHFTLSPSVFIATRLLKVKTVHSLHNYRLLCPSATLFVKDKLFLNSITRLFPVKAIRNKVYKESYLLTLWLTFITRGHHLLGTWKHIDCFIANSFFAKQLFVNSYLQLSPEQIAVKSNFNFLDDTPIATIRNENYLFVGRLSEEKGLFFLLETAVEMGFNIVIIGEGELKQTVINYANTYSNIFYLGRQPRKVVLDELRQCKAMIFPSLWYEGMPLTIIEAMQVGTLVISSEVGVMKEMIQDKVNGLLFRVNDKKNFQAAIQYWEGLSAIEKEQYYLAAYTSFIENYTPKKNAEALLEIYSSNYSVEIKHEKSTIAKSIAV